MADSGQTMMSVPRCGDVRPRYRSIVRSSSPGTGIEPGQAADLVGSPGVTLRAFLGYAGWGEGQLENELKHDTWLVTTVEGEILGKSDGVGLWRQILGSIDPDLKLQAGEPEDPTVN